MNDTPATTLYVVRHGETEWNLVGKQQGHLDSPLTERGIQQAHALAGGLTGRGIDVICSSDLGRALTTAEIIGRTLELPVLTDRRLRERHLGSLQGMTKTEFQETCPDEWNQFSSGNPDYCFPGRESARERYERTIDCVQELAEQHAGKTVLIVAHGGVLNGLFYKTLDIPLSQPRRFSLLNAAINCLTITGTTWRLESWGETAHLAGLKALDDN